MAGLLAAVMMGAVSQATAADTNAPAKPAKPTRFAGTLAAMSSTDKTITVDNKKEKGRVFLITSETKILKDGKPATLSDGVVGEAVRGSYTTGSDGKMSAKTVVFGAAPKKPAAAN